MVGNDLLGLSAATINYQELGINIAIALVLAWVTRLVYVRFGNSLANKSGFAKIFVPLTLTTLLIISVVKSSLALSLGLVGALSIVRFRTAIKDPEELIYLLICIALGLGLGADQRKLTVVVSIVTLIAMIVSTFITKRKTRQKGWYVILKDKTDQIHKSDKKALDILREMKIDADIKRVVQSQNYSELCLVLRDIKSDQLSKIGAQLQQLAPGVEISMLEHEI